MGGEDIPKFEPRVPNSCLTPLTHMDAAILASTESCVTFASKLQYVRLNTVQTDTG